jgi:hypothetical protein
MIQSFTTLAGSFNQDFEVLFYALLADKICQAAWTQRLIQTLFLATLLRINQTI